MPQLPHAFVNDFLRVASCQLVMYIPATCKCELCQRWRVMMPNNQRTWWRAEPPSKAGSQQMWADEWVVSTVTICALCDIVSAQTRTCYGQVSWHIHTHTHTLDLNVHQLSTYSASKRLNYASMERTETRNVAVGNQNQRCIYILWQKSLVDVNAGLFIHSFILFTGKVKMMFSLCFAQTV